MLKIRINDMRKERKMGRETVLEGFLTINDEAGNILARGSDYTFESQTATMLTKFVKALEKRGAVKIIE